MAPKVVVTRPLPKAAAAELAKHADVWMQDRDAPIARDELLAQVADAEGLICVLSDPIDRALLDAAPNLKVVSNIAVGYDNIDTTTCAERGIFVTNTPDVLTETTADLSWALMLATARRVVEADRATRAGEFRSWELLGYLGHDVCGKTLGVVGFGRIGQAVARRAAGFSMRVLYYSRTPASPEVEAMLGAERVELAELLYESHFVSLHTPLNDGTRHLIDRAALEQMRRDAILVNVARGPVVDEAALVGALKAGRIAGAGLDVYEREPALTPGLAELSNTVLLPHIGSASRDTRGKMAKMVVGSCVAALSGRKPRFRVA